MLKQLLELVIAKLDEREKKGSVIENEIVKLMREIDELEQVYVCALAGAERWGDLEDSSHWRTVEVNRLRRAIQAKEKIVETLEKYS